MQNPHIRKKHLQSAFTVKKYKWDRRPSTECHGYDDRLFDYLRTITTEEEEIDASNSIVFSYMNGNESHKYFPDAIVAGRVYEAKSSLTMVKDEHLTRSKANAVLAAGYEYHILLFISKKEFFRFIYHEKEVFVIYPKLYLVSPKKRSNNLVIIGEPKVYIKSNTMQHTNTEDTATYPSTKALPTANTVAVHLAPGSVTGTKRLKRKITAKRQQYIEDSDSDFAPYPSTKALPTADPAHSKADPAHSKVHLAPGSVTGTKRLKRKITATTKTQQKKMKYNNDSDSDFAPKTMTDSESEQ